MVGGLGFFQILTIGNNALMHVSVHMLSREAPNLYMLLESCESGCWCSLLTIKISSTWLSLRWELHHFPILPQPQCYNVRALHPHYLQWHPPKKEYTTKSGRACIFC